MCGASGYSGHIFSLKYCYDYPSLPSSRKSLTHAKRADSITDLNPVSLYIFPTKLAMIGYPKQGQQGLLIPENNATLVRLSLRARSHPISAPFPVEKCLRPEKARSDSVKHEISPGQSCPNRETCQVKRFCSLSSQDDRAAERDELQDSLEESEATSVSH